MSRRRSGSCFSAFSGKRNEGASGGAHNLLAMLLAAPGLFTAAPLLLGWGLLGSGFHHPPAQAQRESTPPAAPTNLVVTNPGFGQININWQEDTKVFPQAGIYSYDVEYTSSTTVADDAPEAAAPNSGFSENRS